MPLFVHSLVVSWGAGLVESGANLEDYYLSPLKGGKHEFTERLESFPWSQAFTQRSVLRDDSYTPA